MCSAHVFPRQPSIETMALTEKQQEKVQVCETNVVRRIVGVKRDGKRRMGEVKECFRKTLVRNMLKWAGHVDRFVDEKVAKRADAQKVEGKWR